MLVRRWKGEIRKDNVEEAKEKEGEERKEEGREEGRKKGKKRSIGNAVIRSGSSGAENAMRCAGTTASASGVADN